jgi:hypothetical protein
MGSNPGWISFPVLAKRNGGEYSPRGKTMVQPTKMPDSFHVERFGSARAAVGAQTNLFDSLFGIPQQIIAMCLQSLAARVDCNRLLKPDSAFFELVHDLFEFFERILERQFGDICVGGGQGRLFFRLS